MKNDKIISYRILCVCLGNICRSPTAEVVLRELSKQHHHLCLHVDSAGISAAHAHEAPDRRSQKYALERGYDLSTLRARQISLQDFCQFDLILAMDYDNLKAIHHLAEQAKLQYATAYKAKIALMSEHDQHYFKQSVPDPYYGDEQDFKAVLDQCESSSQAWIDYLKYHNLSELR